MRSGHASDTGVHWTGADHRIGVETFVVVGVPGFSTMKHGSLRLSPASVIIMLSDIHYDEHVAPHELSGVYNMYTPEICWKRVNMYQHYICDIIDAQRSWLQIDTAYIFLGGDLLSNYIHDDLRETNTLPPVKAAHELVALLESFITYLIQHLRGVSMQVICCYGNHGRLTETKRYKNASGTSIEWLIYRFLKDHVFKSKRSIMWHVPESYMAYVTIGSSTCRFMHGDICGPHSHIESIRARIKRFDKQKHADYTFMGHFHQASDFDSIIINGSMIGPTSYSIHHGFPLEPAQQIICFISHDVGKIMSVKVPCWYTPPHRDRHGRFAKRT